FVQVCNELSPGHAKDRQQPVHPNETGHEHPRLDLTDVCAIHLGREGQRFLRNPEASPVLAKEYPNVLRILLRRYGPAFGMLRRPGLSITPCSRDHQRLRGVGASCASRAAPNSAQVQPSATSSAFMVLRRRSTPRRSMPPTCDR